jgi:hypothetical protein
MAASRSTTRRTSVSGTLTMARSQSNGSGSRIASEIKTGIAPARSDSQKRNVLTPVPRGHSE